MRFEKGGPGNPRNPQTNPIPGISRADCRYWMRWFEKLEPELTNSQKLRFITPVTVALIHSIAKSPVVETQRRYDANKARKMLDAMVAGKRRSAVTTSVKPAAPSENPASPRDGGPGDQV